VIFRRKNLEFLQAFSSLLYISLNTSTSIIEGIYRRSPRLLSLKYKT